MKTIVFIFVPADAQPEDFIGRMRPCVSALEEFRISEDKKAQAEDEAPPFWTWFVDNPRPKPLAPLYENNN